MNGESAGADVWMPPSAPATGTGESSVVVSRVKACGVDAVAHAQPLPSPTSASTAAKERASPDCFPCPIRCDLCTDSTRVYRFQSALYAHLCMKHPHAEAAFEVERMIELARHRMHGDAESSAHVADTSLCSSSLVQLNQSTLSLSSSASALPGASRLATSVSATAKRPSGSLPAMEEKARWWCHECERGFRVAQALFEHKVSKHNFISKPHPCPACKRVFRDAFALERHLMAQHPAIQMADLGLSAHATCPTCRREFMTPEELHRHAIRHHSKRPSMPVRRFDLNLVSPTATTTTTTVPAADGGVIGTALTGEGGVDAAAAKPRKVARRARTTAAAET